EINFGDPSNCAKGLPVQKARIPILTEAADAYRTVHSVCSRPFEKPNPVNGDFGTTAPELLKIVQQVVAMCEAVVAQSQAATTKTAEAPAPSPLRRSANCSDITGTGGPPASQNCEQSTGSPKVRPGTTTQTTTRAAPTNGAAAVEAMRGLL